MRSHRLLKLSLLLPALTALLACEEVDNQSIARGKAWEVANPAADARDFTGNNKKHRLLLAVIDSGVDYNHPLLRDNVHFRLDEKGRPLGSGFDFVGHDEWPAPYVARTAEQDPDAPNTVALKSRQGREVVELAIQKMPALAEFLNPSRAYDQEQGSIDHGTHVAGLMVYDQPELGLLPYRVLPGNIVYKQGQKQQMTLPAVYLSLHRAIEQAIADGARVINMSLAMKDKNGDAKKDADRLRNREFRQFLVMLESLAARHPNVVMVAAAGNESEVIDNVKKFQVPCGVRAPNILCVGALSRQSGLADFTNLIDTGAPFIFAPGTDIWSASPTGLCRSPVLNALADPLPTSWPVKMQNRLLKIDFLTQETWERVLGDCRKGHTPLVQKSGTSMASPIVARMMGQILLEQPQLSGAEAVQKLFEASEGFTEKGRHMRRLRVQKPSWYPRGDVLVEKSGTGRPSTISESFDLVIP